MSRFPGRALPEAVGVALAALLAGCAQVEQSVRTALERNLSVHVAAVPTEKFPADYLPVTKSEIANLFQRFPRTGPDTVFPRVTVTMLEAPSWHMKISPPG